MKLKMLVTAEVIKHNLEKELSNYFDITYDGYNLNHVVMPHEELKRKIVDYDALICEYDTVSRDILESAENLKIIVCCRGGVKSVVDIDAAMEKGVIVCNNPGRNANAVTDMVIGYLIDLTRNIILTSNLIHNKILVGEESSKPLEYKDTVWGLDNNSPFIKYRGDSLNHMTLGIVGFGNAGRLVAKKANAFGMRIIVYDPYCDFGDKPEYVEVVRFGTLLKESDAITVHCVLTPQTKNMFGEKEFSTMKTGSYFINTSRGEVVDESALVKYLKNGHLKGAAIDVTQKEPISVSSNLIGVDNLIITPHIAGSSYDVQYTGTQMVIDSLKSFLENKKPKHAVVYK